MICGDCGETSKPGTEFCPFCGGYLGWQQEPTGADAVTEVLLSPPTGQTEGSARVSEPRTSPTNQPRTPAPAAPAPPAAPERVRPAPASAPAGVAGPTAVVAPPPVAATTVTREAPAATPPSGCPTCGRPLEQGRRFCGHCGEQLILPGAAAPVTKPTRRTTWWTRLWDSRDRVARRAYRRSLPPLYRWRRVIIAVLALGLVGGGLSVIGRSPKTFALARYYDVRNTLVPVPSVTATIIPPGASAPDAVPEALVDGTAKAWQTPWTAATQGAPCNATPTTAVIQLSFPRTRIRGVDLRAGLLANNPNRLLQFRPQKIWIAYADQCADHDLTDVEQQKVAVDTGQPVDSLRIAVQTAFAPDQPTGGQELLSLTEVTLLARPSVR